MKITVKNFGPIREAKDVEISPMTLFVGPSNTGKSYLAVLIYSILITLENRGRQRFQPNKANQQEKKHYVENVDELVDSIFAEDFTPSKARKIAGDLTESTFFLWANHIKSSLKDQILYCFGEAGSNLLKNEKLSVVLSSSNNEILVDIMSPSESKILNETKKIIGDDLFEDTQITLEEIDPESYEDSAPGNFCVDKFISLLRGKHPDLHNCHYLPAIRGGIMQSHRALVDILLEQAPTAGLKDTPSIPMFTGVLANFIRNLIHLRNKEISSDTFPSTKIENEITSIGIDMESNIMQGQIKIEMTDTDYPDFRYKFKQNNEHLDLSLMNTSSMVSELAPISLFIRHYLNNRSIFIVEEPEAHLHPEGQRKIADVLVQLANAGVFVLATTHSDIILEQVSNSILASKLDPAKLKALSKHPTPLKESNSASYSFAERVKESTVVKKIDFDSMTGVITQDHLNVSSDIYNESVSLLEGQEDD